MKNSNRLTLNWFDAYKGLQTAALTAVIMTVGQVVLTEGFSVFTADWAQISKDAVDVSFVATFSYLVKNFFTDKEGML